MAVTGLEQLATQSPHELALATADGRHWSRNELALEWQRLCRVSPATMLRQDNTVVPALVSQHLAQTTTTDSAKTLQIALDLYQLLHIDPERPQLLYCAAPTDEPDVLQLILAFLQNGHPVVLSCGRETGSVLETIRRYRATVLCIDSAQLGDWKQSASNSATDTTLRHLIVANGKDSGIRAKGLTRRPLV